MAELVSGINVVRIVPELRAVVAGWRRAGEGVGLVPTMGALHAGHLALVAEARRRAARTIASIFVNPAQFAPHEDFGKYPRTFEGDCAKLAGAGCDLVWAPTVPVMYPDGFATRIAPEGAALGLESVTRPHFFGGVATVCAKLFIQTGADVALFGEKDYQQLQVVRQIARDLDLPLTVVGYPTVREPDGLAMSSRNAYLSPSERAKAPTLYRTLTILADRLARDPAAVPAIHAAEEALTGAGFRVDYVAVRHAETLTPLADGEPGPRRVLAAAWIGATRLIDNVPVPASETATGAA